MSETTSYDVTLHPGARRELEALSRTVREQLVERIEAASEYRKPTDHPKVEPLSGVDFVRIRYDIYRAVCELASPEFRVLLVDKRRVVYDRLDVAERRAQAGGGR